MKLTSSTVEDFIARNTIKFVNLQFIDIAGRLYSFSMPSVSFLKEVKNESIMFDASSIPFAQGIEQSDMKIKVLFEQSYIDPFIPDKTLNISAALYDVNNQPYEKDATHVVYRAQKFLENSGIADRAFFGPEIEYYLFDSVDTATDHYNSSFTIKDEEANWSNATKRRCKEGYFLDSAFDPLIDIRNSISNLIEETGIEVIRHHHEVGFSQNEVNYKYSDIISSPFRLLQVKSIIRGVSNRFNKTVTFMPKPLRDDNGSGMHVHQSLWRDDKPLFYSADSDYAKLSDTAKYYIGGILKHAKSLNAIVNPALNSYKRLLPGFEAPVKCSYAERNRSAMVRIPISSSPAEKRIELRVPDLMSNPFLAFPAMLMAGIDGIQNKIDPGKPSDFDLFKNGDNKKLRNSSKTLGEAYEALKKDHDYLKNGSVFTDHILSSIYESIEEEVALERSSVTPLEFSLYFNR